jgi:hypothetical protein
MVTWSDEQPATHLITADSTRTYTTRFTPSSPGSLQAPWASAGVGGCGAGERFGRHLHRAAYVGLAVSSHDPAVLATARFDNVRVVDSGCRLLARRPAAPRDSHGEQR